MHVYLFRHGQIELSNEARVIGQTNVPLDDTGRSQARWWSATLEWLELQRIYCSDLARSRETAEILAGTGSVPIVPLPELREIDLGLWDGLTRGEVKASFPGEWEERGRDIANYRPDRGESFADLAARVVPALEAVTASTDGPIAVVGHAGVNRVILCHILGMPLDHLFRLAQDYCALNIIETGTNPWRVTMFNLRPQSEWLQLR
jgi:probable phosphoglycerate mutase